MKTLFVYICIYVLDVSNTIRTTRTKPIIRFQLAKGVVKREGNCVLYIYIYLLTKRYILCTSSGVTMNPSWGYDSRECTLDLLITHICIYIYLEYLCLFVIFTTFPYPEMHHKYLDVFCAPFYNGLILFAFLLIFFAFLESMRSFLFHGIQTNLPLLSRTGSSTKYAAQHPLCTR